VRIRTRGAILEADVFLGSFLPTTYAAGRLFLIVPVGYFRVHCGSEEKGAPQSLVQRGTLGI
jgi:hypothetical protein